jgi:hypothetical protein
MRTAEQYRAMFRREDLFGRTRQGRSTNQVRKPAFQDPKLESLATGGSIEGQQNSTMRALAIQLPLP